MIVLSKKRIVFLVSVLMISVVTIFVNGTVYGEGSLVAGYTVILDAGHGEPDGGAVSDSRYIWSRG